MLQLAGRVIVVTSLEPSAIVDAYAVIKVLSTRRRGQGHRHRGERRTHRRTKRGWRSGRSRWRPGGSSAAPCAYYGFISADPAVRDAVLEQRAIVELLPQSPASRCFRIVASRLAGLGPIGLEHARAHGVVAPRLRGGSTDARERSRGPASRRATSS